MRKIFQLITAIAVASPVVIGVMSQPEHVSPFACNALALSPEARKRHFEEVGPALLKLKKSTHELSDGYEFEFPADKATCQLLTDWVIDERLCCPFLDIELRFSRESGPLWLRLTGRPGIKEFIQEDFGQLLRQ